MKEEISENFLLVISAKQGEHLSKLIDMDCNKISSYDLAKHVHFDMQPYTNFHEKLGQLLDAGGETAFLLSGPTAFLEAELEVGHNLQRRLLNEKPDETDGTPTVQYRDGVELSLDLE